MKGLHLRSLSKRFSKTLFIALGILAQLWIYDQALLNNILPKRASTVLRMGYINLHEAQISAEDLERMKSYDCDLWFFLEWNGHNLDNDPSFIEGYEKPLDEADSKTFGTLVLSKKSTGTTVREIAAEHRPYTCDYPMYEVTFLETPIYLLHAPPNLPGCDYETGDYIEHFMDSQDSTAPWLTSIVVGDLNSLPISKQVRRIEKGGFQNSFSQMSTFPQGTFGGLPWLPKLLQLDYIFHKGAIEPQQVERFSINSSDHSGFIADFTIVKK